MKPRGPLPPEDAPLDVSEGKSPPFKVLNDQLWAFGREPAAAPSCGTESFRYCLPCGGPRYFQFHTRDAQGRFWWKCPTCKGLKGG